MHVMNSSIDSTYNLYTYLYFLSTILTNSPNISLYSVVGYGLLGYNLIGRSYLNNIVINTKPLNAEYQCPTIPPEDYTVK